MANFLDSPQEFNKLNRTIGNIYSNYAMFNDARDTKLYGIPRVGSGVSTFKSPKDIDMYIKSITEGTKPMSGSASYKKMSAKKKEKLLSKRMEPKKAPMKKGKGISAGRVPKGTTPPQLKAWLSVVAMVKKENPELSYKEVLQKAKMLYKK